MALPYKDLSIIVAMLLIFMILINLFGCSMRSDERFMAYESPVTEDSRAFRINPTPQESFPQVPKQNVKHTDESTQAPNKNDNPAILAPTGYDTTKGYPATVDNMTLFDDFSTVTPFVKGSHFAAP
jgi:hypothetical protein